MTVKGGVGSTVILLPTKYLHTRYRDLFGKTPTAYPTVDPGQGQPRPPSPYDAGYYPTATPEQHGGHAMSSALLLDTLAEVYRRMQQQAHSPAGSDAGAGAGTSAAPERLFLHGMKHWYDMVAGRTQ
jgi:hypothetical protein